MKISSIVIVGSEIESWLTAAILSKRNSNLQITIIETEKRRETGVGKTSATNINQLLNMFYEYNETWMKKCDATYNLGFEYYNFEGASSYFQQPFGPVAIPQSEKFTLDYVPLFDLKKIYPNSINNNDILHFISPISFMITRNKMSQSISELTENAREIPIQHITSYHFNANKLIDLIRESYQDHITVHDATTHEFVVHSDKKQNIESITIDDLIGTKIIGDLYIDCSTNGVLSRMNTFIKAESLINDRTIHFSVPFENDASRIKNLKNSTSLVALENGSAKKIPLWNSCEFEYNYSSKFTNKEEMIGHLNSEFSELKIYETEGAQGYFENSLINNVYSIGNSYANIESLSSDSFDLIIQGCFELLQSMTQTEFSISKFDRYRINQNYREYCKKHINLVTYTYLLSNREDTPYWKYVTSEENFEKSIDLYKEFHQIKQSNMLMRDPILLSFALGYNHADPYVDYDILSMSKNDSGLREHIEHLYQGYKSYLDASEKRTEEFSDTYHYTVDHVYSQ